MPLTDPELDLLRELLSDDPTDDVFLQVGEELVRRAEWSEAEDVLRRGLEVHDDPDGWGHLARAALEVGDYTQSLRAWARSGSELQETPELRRVHILALERAGRTEEARPILETYLELDPDDVVLEAARERIEAPPPESELSADDPFLTVRRAERYAAIGRADRAIRIYRRILFHHPEDLAIRSRLMQLHKLDDEDSFPSDLSEELLDPTLVPPDLTMPMPAITSASVEPAPVRSSGPGNKPAGLAAFVASSREAERKVRQKDADEASLPPDVGRPRRRRRKRRSLLKR